MLGYAHGHSTRSRSQAAALIVNESSVPPVVNNKYDPGRATRRNQNPVCTHFSKMRRSIYPSAFFCMNCEWWEREVDHCNKRVSRQSKTYSCKAKHYSWFVPRPLWTVSNNRMLTKEEAESYVPPEVSRKKKKQQNDNNLDDETVCTVDEDDVEDNGSVFNESEQANDIITWNDNIDDGKCPALPLGSCEECAHDGSNNSIDTDISQPYKKRARLVSYQDSLNELQSKYDELLLKTENLRKTVAYWKSRYNQTVQMQELASSHAPHRTRASIVDQLMTDMVILEDRFVSLKQKRFVSRNNFRRHVAECMWHDKRGFFVSLREFFMEWAIDYIRKEVYSPANVLRAMDMAGGQLSIEGIEVLRSCETNGRKYYRNSILPCSAEIRRVGAEVEEFAAKLIPYKYGTLDTGGEFVEWEPEEMIAMVIKGFGLDQQAKERSITIHQAMDGAQLSKNITHVTYGFKMADRGAFCPFSKKPLFCGNEDAASVQSRNNCFPLKIVMERESNKIVDLMRPIISAVKNMAAPGKKWMGANQPIHAPLNSDMSATWKIFQVGGAAKRDEQPCHCCAIRSNDLSHANVEKCSRFCKNEDDVCYHQTFLSSDNIAELQTHYDLLQSTLDERYQSYEQIRLLSQMDLDEDPGAPTGEGRVNERSIHFDFEAENVTYATRAKYNRTINNELRIRNLVVSSATLHERQQQLREACVKERGIYKLGLALRHGKKLSHQKHSFHCTMLYHASYT